MNTTELKGSTSPLAIVPPTPKPDNAPEGKAKAPRSAKALPANKRIAKGDKLAGTMQKIAAAKVSDLTKRDRLFTAIAKDVPADEDAAFASIVAAIPRIERDVVRLDTVGLAALAISFRPIVAWLASPRAGKDQLDGGIGMAAKVVAFAKAHLSKGTLTRVQTGAKAGDTGVPISVKVLRAWERLGKTPGDATSRMLDAARAQLLLSYPGSSVVVGYTDKAPGTFRATYRAKGGGGKAGQPSFAGICVPANVVQPVVYGAVESDPKAREPGKGFPGLKPRANTDKTLIGLDSDLITALYFVHFGNVTPRYATHVSDPNMGVPTGMMLPFRGEPKARQADAGTGTKTGSTTTTLPDPAAIHAAGLVFRDVPASQWPDTHKDIREQIYAYAFALSCLLHRGCNDGSTVAKSFADSKAAAACLDALNCLQSFLRSNPDGSGDVMKDGQHFRIPADLGIPPTVAQPAARKTTTGNARKRNATKGKAA